MSQTIMGRIIRNIPILLVRMMQSKLHTVPEIRFFTCIQKIKILKKIKIRKEHFVQIYTKFTRNLYKINLSSC